MASKAISSIVDMNEFDVNQMVSCRYESHSVPSMNHVELRYDSVRCESNMTSSFFDMNTPPIVNFRHVFL